MKINKKILFIFVPIFIIILILKYPILNINNNKNGVKYNGWLHTNGSKLLNEKNKEIQLKGISSHGIQWYYDILTQDNLASLKNDWGITVFRIALYTDPNSSGYISNPEELKQKLYKVVDICINLDIYIIIDWHILSDNNPQYYKQQSADFFREVSDKYSDCPNIIYEICNEPNGNNVTWSKDIKPYAEEIIPIIRENSPKSLIIVGTPDWSKKIEKVVDEPLNFENIVYACHFYAGSHTTELRESIDYCISKNIPIFVSECGITDATGDGAIYENEFRTWISYLNSKNISWIYWSFSDKNEGSAIVNPEYTKSILDSKNIKVEEVNIINFNDYLTNAGNIVKSLIKSN